MRITSVPDAFKAAADEKHIKVYVDEGGVSIARETEINGMIYAQALDVTDELENRPGWGKLFDELDRQFASLLAYHGHIPLPAEYRGA